MANRNRAFNQVVTECLVQRKVSKLPMVLASAILLLPQIQTPRDRRNDFKIIKIGHFEPIFLQNVFLPDPSLIIGYACHSLTH